MEVTYDSFVESHGPSLKGSGVPEIFWPVLLQKLAGQIFDAGEDFGLAENESKIKGVPRGRLYRVVVKNEEGIDATDPKNIWLIDHCWTFSDRQEAKKQLLEHPELPERLVNLMNLDS